MTSQEADMTCSPFPVIPKPFSTGLLDYTQDYHVDDPNVLVRFDDGSDPLDFRIFAILDVTSSAILITEIIVFWLFIVAFRDRLLLREVDISEILIQVLATITLSGELSMVSKVALTVDVMTVQMLGSIGPIR